MTSAFRHLLRGLATSGSRHLARASACALLALSPAAFGQAYIGFVYPAGGQRGATFQVTLGGQGVETAQRVLVNGEGVTARVIEYNKRMNPQEIQLISEQARELRNTPTKTVDPKYTNMVARIERIIRDNVDQPASASIANLIVAEVTIASDAPPGQRELRVATKTGLSNPLVFMVGEIPEYSGPPVPPSRLITLGKEAASLRRKSRTTNAPAMSDTMMQAMMSSVGPSGLPSDLDDEVVRVELPHTVNGQITSGAVDRYRFAAKKGQRLVISTQARELVPYMADAVPGWFQLVVALWDSKGREVAYTDDYRFKPDPVLFYDVPEDGDYLLAVYDAIYRGREDFVYRVSIGELPFITSLFPLGAKAGAASAIAVKGANLAEAEVAGPAKEAAAGVQLVSARGKGGLHSNRAPFALDSLPECVEQESNDSPRKAQKVKLPVIVNGRIDRPGDTDVFQLEGRAGEDVVAEVVARRLDSPLDSVLKITDAGGRVLAINDDREDAGTGLNTHHADSYVRVTLPADGTYRVHLNDTQRAGGEEFAYRLRVSAPQTDFALRVVPSMMTIRSNAPAYPRVYAIRKDGYTGPIKITLKDPPPGIEMVPVTLTGTQAVTSVTVKTSLNATNGPMRLTIIGTATNRNETVVREAVPAEDRMQAFLWRHLVPVQDLTAMTLPMPPPPPKADPAKPAAPAKPGKKTASAK